ncbi:Torsin-1A-interacting protein 2 [Sciurus carolinensis]|uniref:Torsin-1A-interacting protein 2 n=1 Tax=Sciurus carolinensis TaxID=30640 RepID=A0AA41T9X8_SCICA|nr:Torsin-1A-interacting protein 2 [Sciurus carolinensis]
MSSQGNRDTKKSVLNPEEVKHTMTDSGLGDPPEDSQKDLENDPSVNSQAQETTVTASAIEEVQTPHLASGLKDHQEVEAKGLESTGADDKSERPDETNAGSRPETKTEHESSTNLEDRAQGHCYPSEGPGEDPLDPDPSRSPGDEVGRAAAGLGSVSAALPKDVSDQTSASEEPPAADSPEALSPGHSSTVPEGQDSLRRRLPAPGTESHEQETQRLEEKEESAKDTVRKIEKKNLWNCGSILLVCLAVFILGLSFVNSYYSSPAQQVPQNTALEAFLAQFSQLKDKFPGQSPFLWQRGRKFLQKHLNASNPTEPATIIFTAA